MKDSFRATASTFDGLRRRSPLGLLPQLHSSRSTSPTRSITDSTSKANTINQLSASDFYVPSLPGQPKDSSLILFAGHLPFSPPDSKIEPEKDSYGFFFLNKARHIGNRPVLMIWLNGGPGCSSFDGSLMEIGPLRMVLKGDGALKEVPAAWNEYANILFIDQPVGTGYSFGPQTDYVHELDVSSSNLINFLARFFKVFPEYQKMDLYVGGESFAGQYVPYLAQAILDTNIITAPLKGMIIGNGWVDPVNQYLAYPDFAFRVGLVDPSSKAAELIRNEAKKCNESIALNNKPVPIHIPACEGILSAITDSTVQTVNSQKMCLNMYDVRLVDTYPACGLTWPPDLADITPYLSRPDVKTALHAERHVADWVECEPRVGSSFWAKTSRPSITLFPKLLDQIKVLLFSGDSDLICCHDGTERMIDNLSWGGYKGWTSAAISLPWKVNGTYAGTWKEERNLTYVLVANGSHMAPYDVPYATQDMLVRFLGIDAISAAGPAGQVTSRIGAETATTVNRVLLNETKLASALLSSTSPLAPEALNATKGEDYYNASSATMFLILFGMVVGLIYFMRRRSRRSGLGDYGNQPESDMMLKAHHHEPSGSGQAPPVTDQTARDVLFEQVPTDDEDEPHRQPPRQVYQDVYR